MSKLQVVLTLLMAISTIANGQSQTDKSEKQPDILGDWVSLKEDKCEIKYPPDWEVNKSGLMGTTFMLFSPLSSELDNFKENVNLLVQNLSGYDLTLDQYVEISEGQIQTMLTEGKVILSERMNKNGQEYHKLIYSGKQGIFDLKFEQLFYLVDNHAFVISLTCEQAEFDKYQSTGEKILNSFELK